MLTVILTLAALTLMVILYGSLTTIAIVRRTEIRDRAATNLAGAALIAFPLSLALAVLVIIYALR